MTPHRSVLLLLAFVSSALRADDTLWSANDATRVARHGAWQWTGHRYAAENALVTAEDGAALELSFRARALVLRLDPLTPPNYHRPPELGALDVIVDGRPALTLHPQVAANEVLLLRNAGDAERRVRIVHRRTDAGAGCRIRGFRVVTGDSGDLAFTLTAEQNAALVDVRAIVTADGRVVRDELVRNRLSGECRLAGLPLGADYALELRAAGWITRRVANIAITAGQENRLPPIHLAREADVPTDAFKFPAPGHPVVRRPGESFRARFEGNQAEIHGVRLVRRSGPATISRVCEFAEDRAAAFYYHREGTVSIPAGAPPGVYDLEIILRDRRGAQSLVSPRSVTIVNEFPGDPVFVGWGHLDTWGQFQAEYVERLVALANLIAPDLVLVSNEANPAYAAGALRGLEAPFVINFGNHRAPEPAPWFGEPVGAVDFGPAFTVVNFGRSWDTDTTQIDALLATRRGVPIKIINAFEANAPVPALLDRHGVSLIHYAHGPGPAVAKIGATPTTRVGKSNSESFRVIRFRHGRPESYTYRGHATAPFPFPRGGPAPIRVVCTPAADGAQRQIAARVENDLEEDFPNLRVTLVMPAGRYRASAGRVEHQIDSDDARFTVVAVRLDVPARAASSFTLAPAER